MMADTALDTQTDSGKPMRACKFCQDILEVQNNQVKFCCDLCREEHLAGQRRVKSFDPERATVDCKGCGMVFVPTSIKALFCDKSCAARHFAEVRNESGQGARLAQKWRERNPEKYSASKVMSSKKRYAEIKATPALYEGWRGKMSDYHCEEKRREAQRRRISERALAMILLPAAPAPKV
jgi:Zn finger protein HypA/HybF involved in hydrogenase expression